MTEPVWLDREIVLALQSQLVARFGGLEGIRDGGLLDSALGRPQQRFNYESPDLFDLAATYAHGIVKNHPFLDGNKRAGFMSAYTFLRANRLKLQAPEEEAVSHTLALAAGEIDADAYATWLRTSSIRA
jgi:death-on-curing protein